MPSTAHNRNGKKERLEARVSPEQKRLFLRAASLDGSTLSEFVIATLQSVAKQTIQDHEILRLSERDRKFFVETLLHPPRPNQKLREAFDEYRKSKVVYR